MGVDLQTYLPDDLLRMGDRMSMVHSLELRVPFLRPPSTGFCLFVARNNKTSRMEVKEIHEIMLCKIFCQKVLSAAKKRGFMLPLARWLREDLREMSRDLLSDEDHPPAGLCQSCLCAVAARRTPQWPEEFHGSTLCAHGVGVVASASGAVCLLPSDGSGHGMNVVLLAEVTIEQVIGGAERVLRQQALGLAKLGHHVRVIARAPFESAEASLAIGSVTEQRYSVTRTSEPAFVWSSVQNSLRAFDLTQQTSPIDDRDDSSIAGRSRSDSVPLWDGQSLGLYLSLVGA